MCLAVPMKIIQIEDNVATVELSGTQRKAGLDIMDPKPVVGDYVLVHAGFVINVIDEKEAEIILDDFKTMVGEDFAPHI